MSIKATPNFLSVSATDFDVDFDAPDPVMWLSFLQSLWPRDPQSIATPGEMFGYLLTADTSQQKIFLLVGPLRSGNAPSPEH